MRIFCNLFIFFFLILTLDSFAAQNNSIFVVAKVDNQVITNIDLSNRYKIILKMSKIRVNNAGEKRIILNQVLQKMIDEKLQIIEAKNLGIELDQDRFEALKEDLANDLGLKINGLEDYFKNHGLSYDNFTKQIEAQILWSEIVRVKVMPQVKVGQSEIAELLELRGVKTEVNKYYVSEILIPLQDKNQNIDGKSLAQKLFNELKSGKDFEIIAKQFSRSPTAEFGGEIGWIGKGDIDEQFYNAISKIKVDEVTEPIVSKDGYYLFKLAKKQSFNILTQQDNDQLTRIISNKKMQLSAKGYLMDLRKSSYVETDEEVLMNLSER